jgi:hypothetical protein
LMGRFLVLGATRVCRNRTVLRDTGSGNEDNRAKGPSRHTHRSPMAGRRCGSREVAYELQRIIAGLPPFWNGSTLRAEGRHGVVAGVRTSLHVRFIHLHLQLVVFVRVLGARRIEAQCVIGLRFGDTAIEVLN